LFATLRNAWKIPDLQKRMIYTLMMIVIFRLGAHVPVPGVDANKLATLFANEDGLFGFFNLLSGGSFKRFSIFALGISPYITASIIVNLLQIAIPSLEQLAKEGEEGRKKLAQMTRYGTVILALIQAVGMSVGIFRPAFIEFNTTSVVISVMTLTAGVAFLMYLGEKITENGIGNGISIFIFAGIISRLPVSIQTTVFKVINNEISIFAVILFVVLAIGVIMGVIYIQQGQRKVPVQYAKRVVGRKSYGGHSTHIPLKVNQAGVIPVIFSMSLLMFPMTIAQFMPQSSFYAFMSSHFNTGSLLYNFLYALLIIAFTYFYTSVTFNPYDVAENMKKNGGFVPGIRPGKPTAEYIMRTLNRITFAGAIFLAMIAVMPNLLSTMAGTTFRFGGTSLLIAVGVSIETMKQIESQMIMRHYQGFLK
jgi:preprotein translocase subunit SecY